MRSRHGSIVSRSMKNFLFVAQLPCVDDVPKLPPPSRQLAEGPRHMHPLRQSCQSELSHRSWMPCTGVFVFFHM